MKISIEFTDGQYRYCIDESYKKDGFKIEIPKEKEEWFKEAVKVSDELSVFIKNLCESHSDEERKFYEQRKQNPKTSQK